MPQLLVDIGITYYCFDRVELLLKYRSVLQEGAGEGGGWGKWEGKGEGEGEGEGKGEGEVNGGGEGEGGREGKGERGTGTGRLAFSELTSRSSLLMISSSAPSSSSRKLAHRVCYTIHTHTYTYTHIQIVICFVCARGVSLIADKTCTPVAGGNLEEFFHDEVVGGIVQIRRPLRIVWGLGFRVSPLRIV